jgi:hypothetical protein
LCRLLFFQTRPLEETPDAYARNTTNFARVQRPVAVLFLKLLAVPAFALLSGHVGAEAVMRDLRVYSDSLSARAQGRRSVFYSRRADGPVYLWLYEEAEGRWRFVRVRLSKFDLNALCAMRLEAVPVSLRARLHEHYLE